MDNLLITENSWSDWKLNPVTQKFMDYMRMGKYDIARQKMAIISGPVSEIDPSLLSLLNGMENILTQLLKITPEELSGKLRSWKEETQIYKREIKDNLGVEL